MGGVVGTKRLLCKRGLGHGNHNPLCVTFLKNNLKLFTFHARESVSKVYRAGDYRLCGKWTPETLLCLRSLSLKRSDIFKGIGVHCLKEHCCVAYVIAPGDSNDPRQGRVKMLFVLTGILSNFATTTLLRPYMKCSDC